MPHLFPERRSHGRVVPAWKRKFAEECRRLAGSAESGQYRAILEQMAEVWLRLAAKAEQQRSRPPS
jgi:hypothetical protein